MDQNRIPSGNVIAHPSAPPPHTVFNLGADSPAFDDCFVMDPSEAMPLDTRTSALRQQVSLSHPATSLHLEIFSTEPAFQFYTGEGIDVPELETKNGHIVPSKGPRAGIAIEPCRYVDAQRNEWRGQCLLKKGQVWGARSQYRAWKETKH